MTTRTRQGNSQVTKFGAVSPPSPLSVVVCCKDRALLLKDALVAIGAVLRPGDEIVVVDSASKDDSVQRVAAQAGVTVVRCERAGQSRARNQGIRASSAPLIAFTDDDCRPRQGWLEALVDAFAGDLAIGFVTGRVLPDREDGPMLSVLVDDEPRTFVYGSTSGQLGHGANFAVRREAITAVGGFDEALGIGGGLGVVDDHDAFWRILRAGWTGRYSPEAVMVHHQWRNRSEYLRTELGYGLGGGAMAVKAMRMDPRGGWRFLWNELWRDGAMTAVRALREGNETGAAGTAVRTVAAVAGAMRAWRAPLYGGLYDPPPDDLRSVTR
jgi:glycosyltransferase involved in cell wall biosynthesis